MQAKNKSKNEKDAVRGSANFSAEVVFKTILVVWVFLELQEWLLVNV